MRRARWGTGLLSILLVLLLTGCGGTAETVGSLPETAPAEPLSAPAVVTAGRAPEAAYDLPTEAEDFHEWMLQGMWGDQPVGLLAELPEQDAALYGVHSTKGDTALLRWEDSLAAFNWSFGGPLLVAPQFQVWDIDQDEQEEIVFINHVGSGTGVSIEALHVVEKNADGTLTDYCLPSSLFDKLSVALRVETVNSRTYAILGTELVELTSSLPEGADPDGVMGLAAGNIVRFEASPNFGRGALLHFESSACLVGDDYPRATCYVVDITAAVRFENGIFTLTNLHLNSMD